MGTRLALTPHDPVAGIVAAWDHLNYRLLLTNIRSSVRALLTATVIARDQSLGDHSEDFRCALGLEPILPSYYELLDRVASTRARCAVAVRTPAANKILPDMRQPSA